MNQVKEHFKRLVDRGCEKLEGSSLLSDRPMYCICGESKVGVIILGENILEEKYAGIFRSAPGNSEEMEDLIECMREYSPLKGIIVAGPDGYADNIENKIKGMGVQIVGSYRDNPMQKTTKEIIVSPLHKEVLLCLGMSKYLQLNSEA